MPVGADPVGRGAGMLTVLLRYRLTGAPQDFAAAVAALSEKVRVDGHPGVMSYRFFLNSDGESAMGVVDYDTPAAWLGHHHIAMAWPEMQRLHGVARLARVTFLGKVTREITDWIAKSTLTAELDTGFEFSAGFRR